MLRVDSGFGEKEFWVIQLFSGEDSRLCLCLWFTWHLDSRVLGQVSHCGEWIIRPFWVVLTSRGHLFYIFCLLFCPLFLGSIWGRLRLRNYQLTLWNMSLSNIYFIKKVSTWSKVPLTTITINIVRGNWWFWLFYGSDVAPRILHLDF